jgi:hypothetical protein
MPGTKEGESNLVSQLICRIVGDKFCNEGSFFFENQELILIKHQHYKHYSHAGYMGEYTLVFGTTNYIQHKTLRQT